MESVDVLSKTLETNTARWLVLYTKPRNEKKVTERLTKKGFEMYCPLMKTLRQWSDRKKKVEVPMFPGYIFAFVTEKERLALLQDPGVLNFVFWQGKPAVVRPEEIEAIQNIVSFGQEVQVEGDQLMPGQYIEIPEGPFKGLTGQVDKIDKTKVLVYIEQLGCTIQFKYESI